VRLLTHVRHVLDFCYPRLCAVCEAAGTYATQVCPDCLEALKKLETAPACEKCAMPLATQGAPCPHCASKGVYPFDRIVRLGIHQEPLRNLIHQIKYRGQWPLAEFLADRLVAQPRAREVLSGNKVLVPVPLYPWRQISRGYNQAEIVARRIGRVCKIKVAPALVRLQNTETQTHIHSKDIRYENLRDAFGLMRPRPVRGRHVVLVDDVMTTGATLTWAARTLAEANPASISAVVIAIADPRGRGFETI
jgi:ComF family protein